MSIILAYINKRLRLFNEKISLLTSIRVITIKWDEDNNYANLRRQNVVNGKGDHEAKSRTSNHIREYHSANNPRCAGVVAVH